MTTPYHPAPDSQHVATTASGAIRLAIAGDAFVTGSHKFTDPQLADTAARHGAGAAWVAAFEQYGTAAPTKVHGDFAVAVRDHQGRIFLAVDRFAIRTLCYRIDGDSMVVQSAPTSSLIHRHRGIRRPSSTTSTSTSFLPRARSSKVYSVCRRRIAPASSKVG